MKIIKEKDAITLRRRNGWDRERPGGKGNRGCWREERKGDQILYCNLTTI